MSAPLSWSPQTSSPSAWPAPPGISSPLVPGGCHHFHTFSVFYSGNYRLCQKVMNTAKKYKHNLKQWMNKIWYNSKVNTIFWKSEPIFKSYDNYASLSSLCQSFSITIPYQVYFLQCYESASSHWVQSENMTAILILDYHLSRS